MGIKRKVKNFDAKILVMLMNGYVPFSSEEDFFMRRNKNCDSQTGFDSYSYLDRSTTALPALLVLMGV